MGSPLRVLHVVVNMNRGGAETLIMNLYRNIDRSKVQFDFLTCKEGVFDSEIVAMGGKVHRIPYISEVGHFQYKSELANFFTNHSEYKVAHSHMDKMSGFILQAAKKANIPIRIAHSHSTKSEGGFLSKSYKSFAGSQIRRSATHLYACSHVAAQWLFGNRANKAFILKNGIDTDKFQFSSRVRDRIRRELQIDSNTLVLGHVGRFSQPKNHLFLLDIFACVNKKVPNSILVLAGDGPLKTKVEEKINELNLDKKVKLLGMRQDIHYLLQAFDLLVFPSLYEGLPVTLVEAQGTGLPCVISDTVSEEVDMGLGLIHFLPLKNEKLWIENITKLAQYKHSRIVSKNALSLKGYDIRKTAQITQVSYLSFWERAI